MSVNVFEGVVLVAVEGDLVAGPVFLAAPPDDSDRIQVQDLAFGQFADYSAELERQAQCECTGRLMITSMDSILTAATFPGRSWLPGRSGRKFRSRYRLLIVCLTTLFLFRVTCPAAAHRLAA